ncbi:MAG: 4-hydroxythreonine-4-phosphate dehydrogenase PdxA [Alphaproteobacteria bacterium]|nr:4-hydroxythreonine-4-phosphate dehydrogenase PdxA [Alphaproteobacteria bacterium]
MKPIALTMGEPAGIGGEIAVAAWRRRAENLPPFFAVDDAARLAALGVPVAKIGHPAEAATAFDRALPVLVEPLPSPVRPGQPDAANASAVIRSIERAVALAKTGDAAAVVTNPIHKASLYAAGFRYPDHTEFLGALAGAAKRPVMLLAAGDFRVVPVTVHLALRQALATLDRNLIVDTGEIVAAALKRDFGIARPRLTVAGVNPHAGEDGGLGREEIEIVAPAVAALAARGLAVSGPTSPDTLFHPEARATYDAVLCMYHDQALIPLKTVDFWGGVNVTLGLSIVRASPDHGTAFRLAGTGRADPASLMAALRLAAEIARRRGLA